MSERLLVVGASGLVGAELARRASSRFQVLGVARHVRGLATATLDLADRQQIEKTVAGFRPDVIALCSAWPHVDGCEADPVRSHRENVETVANLLTVTKGSKTRVLFFSTDHVFDGAKASYVESDAVHPPSVYAQHKREVEELLLARGRSLVARTAWVFGAELARKNFLCRVVDACRSGETLRVPIKQGGCPTWAGWLSESAMTLLREGMDGVVHLTGREPLTKAEWATLIARELALPPLRVVEIPWAESGQVAPRPERVVLATERHTLIQPPLAAILSAERASLMS